MVVLRGSSHMMFSVKFFFLVYVHAKLLQLCLTLQSHGLQNARLPRLPFTISQSLLKLTYIELVMPSNHLVLCCPLLILPSIFPSIRVFSNDSALPIRWPKYWNFSFSISPSKEYSGLISFKMDCLDLLAAQGAPKCLVQHCSSKASILQRSAFFIVQLSQPYMTTGKIIALTRRTFVGTVSCGTSQSPFTKPFKYEKCFFLH